MLAIKTILCPTDLSDASHHAFEHAVAIAGYYKAEFVLLHVVSPTPVLVPGYAPIGGPFFPPEALSAEIERAKLKVREVLAPVTASGIHTRVDVTSGPTVATILEKVGALDADLLVMGTHGAGGFEHLVLGSVTEKVMRKAPCPVLTVPPRAQATSKLPFERLLCPIDFSSQSLAAFELACSLARESGAYVTMLHVVDWPDHDATRAPSHFEVPEYTRYLEDDAMEQLQRLAKDVAGEGVSPVVRLAHGKPYRQVLEAARDTSADLIVMGVHGRNALNAMLFGSTTNQVVRRATCPVLTLRQ